ELPILHRYARTFGHQKLVLLTLILLVITLFGCKNNRRFSKDLSSAASCLFDEPIRSMEVGVVIDDIQTGHIAYNYQFADNLSIPYLESSQTESLPTSYNGRTVIGNTMNQGLTVRSRFSYFKADFTTGCYPATYWSSLTLWPQNPTIKVQVNGRDLFEATFEPLVTDIQQGCESGKVAKNIVLPAITNLEQNPVFKSRKQECSS
ncbi:MAG: hypothetical protein OXC40_06160, partial [Proteobacteria bacterium]|nr:hypothetical protein [Pseudomonadota bacterium]